MGQDFQTTRWSVVLDARDGSGAEAGAALGALCELYWYPLYAYVRRRGHSAEEAADLTQAYFAELIEKRFLDVVRPERGRFRSFLLKSMQHFMSHERERARALKRGGPRPPLSLDLPAAEQRYALEPREEATPETLYERRWATEVLERVLGRLARDAAERGRAEQFRELSAFLTGASPAPSQREVARTLGMSEPAVRVAVHRLRQRFGQCLRDEIAETVAEPEEVDAEIRHLFSRFER